MHETERQALEPGRTIPPAAEESRAAPLAHVLRGGRIESVHAGHVAVVDVRGRLLAWAGDPRVLVFPRSSFKPYQALPLVESGALRRAGLGADALALIAGSHGGTDRHAAIARSILAAAGVDEKALRCGEHTPYDEATAAALAARGEAPGPLRHNCSGKHAGMLLLARATGAPAATYLDPEHPVQRTILGRFAAVVGDPGPDRTPAIDGCSAPAPRMPLATLAHAFALLAAGVDAAGRPAPALEEIRDAMRAHPENVAGDGRLDTTLMRAARNLVAKAGAEGVHAAGDLARSVGVAVKVADGTRRALAPAVVSSLAGAGILDERALSLLASLADEPIRNVAGLDVGRIRGVARLTRSEP